MMVLLDLVVEMPALVITKMFVDTVVWFRNL